MFRGLNRRSDQWQSHRLKVSHGEVFPHGAFLIGDVEAVRDFERSHPGAAGTGTDKETGLLMWSVSVLDADPDARKDVKTVTVKIAAPHQPVPRRRWRGCRSGRWSSTG